MYDPATAVKDLLVTANMGQFNAATGWSIHVGDFPESPDTVILCTVTGGRAPYPHLLINEPSVQVMVRGAKSGYEAASTKIRNVVDALLGMNSTTLGGDVYRSCNQIGDVAYLSKDSNMRPIFVANFWFIVLPASGTGYRTPI